MWVLVTSLFLSFTTVEINQFKTKADCIKVRNAIIMANKNPTRKFQCFKSKE